MEIIFSIIGLTFLGLVARAIFKDKDIAEKPKDSTSLIMQLVISLIVGVIVWSALPKSCKHSNDYDSTDTTPMKYEQ